MQTKGAGGPRSPAQRKAMLLLQANGAGAGTKKRARRSGVSKPAVVITELPYQSNKVGGGGINVGPGWDAWALGTAAAGGNIGACPATVCTALHD